MVTQRSHLNYEEVPIGCTLPEGKEMASEGGGERRGEGSAGLGGQGVREAAWGVRGCTRGEGRAGNHIQVGSHLQGFPLVLNKFL